MTHLYGGYLTVARADAVTPLVNEIMESAVAAGADCLVTSCPMCQLNLESRCTLPNKLPILHFSEVLALALGAQDYDGWFAAPPDGPAAAAASPGTHPLILRISLRIKAGRRACLFIFGF